jgi:hypothetical protein
LNSVNIDLISDWNSVGVTRVCVHHRVQDNVSSSDLISA